MRDIKNKVFGMDNTFSKNIRLQLYFLKIILSCLYPYHFIEKLCSIGNFSLYPL